MRDWTSADQRHIDNQCPEDGPGYDEDMAHLDEVVSELASGINDNGWNCISFSERVNYISEELAKIVDTKKGWT